MGRGPELTLEDRKEVQRLISLGTKLVGISDLMDRALSCIGKEIRRNGGYAKYNAEDAHAEHLRRKEKKHSHLFKKFSDIQLDIINEGIKNNLSMTRISRNADCSYESLRSYIELKGINYTVKAYAGIEARIASLEAQMEIVLEQLRRIK